MAISDLFGSVDTNSTFLMIWSLIPIVISFIVIGACIIFVIWYIKFRYRVKIYSIRANGEIVKSKTKGGFSRNVITKQETFKLLGFKYKNAFVPPFPNKFIELDEKGKDLIRLFRTTEGEYIPMTLKENNKDKILHPIITYKIEKDKDGNEKKVEAGIEYKDVKELIVHDDWLIDHLAARDRYNINKFTLKTAFEKYGQVISLSIILAIFFLGMYFSTEYAKYVVTIATGLAQESIKVPVVSTILLIPAKLIFKK